MSNQLSTGDAFDRELPVGSSVTAANFATVTLRVVIGWTFLYSGLTKILDPGWTATGYLTHAIPAGNPFATVWPVLASVPAVDLLVQWGLALTGIGLIVGAFVRWNAFWAAVMMLLFWASSLPLENGLVVDQHVVYVLVLGLLVALGAGRIIGIDAYLEDSSFVRRHRTVAILLG